MALSTSGRALFILWKILPKALNVLKISILARSHTELIASGNDFIWEGPHLGGCEPVNCGSGSLSFKLTCVCFELQQSVKMILKRLLIIRLLIPGGRQLND